MKLLTTRGRQGRLNADTARRAWLWETVVSASLQRSAAASFGATAGSLPQCVTSVPCSVPTSRGAASPRQRRTFWAT